MVTAIDATPLFDWNKCNHSKVVLRQVGTLNGDGTMKLSRNALLAAAFVLSTGTAVYAQGQTPVPTPSNPGGSVQQQEMNRNNGSSQVAPAPRTSGSGAMQDSTKTKAGDPLKKSMDDPKQYGSPDKH
jgi:hypothetical protein